MNQPLKIQKIRSINPATLEVNAEFESLDEERVHWAVYDAWKGFSYWSTLSFKERAEYMFRVRDIIHDDIDKIVEVISLETGKPRIEALTGEILPVLELITYFAKNTEKILKKEAIKLGKWTLLGRRSYVEYHPLGVIGIISPWNFPFSIPFGEIVIALMAGNTVVHKPSEYTPLTGKAIQEVFERAELPENAVITILGDGQTGGALVRSNIKKIIFTGSVATGKKIMATAAERLTPVVLELGGKDPMVVLEDADIEKASDAAVWGAFFNSGQVCASVERLYVHESIYDKFTELVVNKTKRLRQGTDNDYDVEIGSLTNERQLKIVETQVEEARRHGAKILTGGERKKELKGYFYKPTVVTGVSHAFPLLNEETFGPVLPIIPFKSDDEAVHFANDSKYGLTASIWSTNLERAKQIASRLHFGTITINDNLLTHGIPQTPWGGVKESGFGRTHGKEGLLEMVEVRHIHINRSTLPNLWWYPYSEKKYRLFKNALTLLYGRGLLRRLRSLFNTLKGAF
jgi:succinate-semialdehyde dehydrogenase/glutarate-semialdehyde dehydrogenase